MPSISASPISNCCRSPNIRSTPPGAISRSACSRRPRRFGDRRRASRASSTARTRRGSASSSTGCRRISRSTRMASPISTARALYEHADPRKGFHPDWNTAIYDFGRKRGRQLSLSPARSIGSTASTSTACASMRSPRCSISTIRASRANGSPNADGGNENHDAIAFIRRANELVYGALSRRGHDRRGIDRLSRRLAGRPTSAASASASNGTWAGCTTRSNTCARDPVHRRWSHDKHDLRPALRLHREFRAADLA